MLPRFLLPETVAHQDGVGTEIALEDCSKPMLLTLGINRILEQESLDLSIWGSPDGQTWRQIAAFPQKFYCGTYQILLDLTAHPDLKYLRVKWAVARWGKGDPKPLFGIYLFAQAVKHQLLAVSA